MSKENKTEPTDKKKIIKKIIKIALIIVVGIIVICLLPFISIILHLLGKIISSSVFLDSIKEEIVESPT